MRSIAALHLHSPRMRRHAHGFFSDAGVLRALAENAKAIMAGNSIVLVDQADAEIGAGKERLLAITDAAVSHARPVFQGALTTIPGVATLLADPFFKSMAVTILFGVVFATILTLVVVPLLYTVVFRVSSDPAFENVRGSLVQPILGRTMGDTIHKKSRP
jgi:hypothetical protein